MNVIECTDPTCESKQAAEEFGYDEFFLCTTCDHETEAACEHEATQKHGNEDHEPAWAEDGSDLADRIG